MQYTNELTEGNSEKVVKAIKAIKMMKIQR
jgi:hypothetical protein